MRLLAIFANGDASGIAKGGAFARVRKKLRLPITLR
jgi:hypothetical protein